MNSIVKINSHKITTKHNQTGRYSPILQLSSDVRHVLICVIDVYPVAINWLFITGVYICCLCFWLLTPLHSYHIEASDKMAVILQVIYWLKKVFILIKIPLQFVPAFSGQLFSMGSGFMAWHQTGGKPLPEPVSSKIPEAISPPSLHELFSSKHVYSTKCR